MDEQVKVSDKTVFDCEEWMREFKERHGRDPNRHDAWEAATRVVRAEAQQRLTDAQGEVKRLRARFGAVGTRLAAAGKLAQAARETIDWECEYRGLNHLGKNPPQPFPQLAIALAEWEAAGK